MFSLGPKQLCEFFGLTRSEFRYWRNTIDVNSSRRKFSANEIMCYMIIKRLIKEYHVKAADIAKAGPQLFMLFDGHTSIDDCIDLFVVFNPDKQSLRLISWNDSNAELNQQCIVLAMNAIMLEYLNTVTSVGMPRNMQNQFRSIYEVF